MSTRYALCYLLLCCVYRSFSINEWNFEGPNIAFNKNAIQGPGTLEEGTADKAVDGIAQNSGDGNICAHTTYMYSTDSWWKVDLGDEYRITGIRITNRDHNAVRSRLNGMAIVGYISENGSPEILYQDANTTLSCENKYPNVSSSICANFIQIPINDTQQFQLVEISTPDYLMLCEVEVFAAVCTIPYVDNGWLDTKGSGMFKPGDMVAVRCNNTYAPINPTTTCTNKRTWEPDPSCTNISCVVPDVDHGQFFLNEQLINSDVPLTSGSEIQLSCFVGYTPVPVNVSFTCQNTGEWSAQELKCTRITCNDLPFNFTYGEYDFGIHSQLYDFNHKIFPICHKGFYLQNGTARQCTEMDSWSGEEPLCSPITCALPSKFTHGIYNGSQTVYSYRSVLLPSCDTGYYIANNVTERVCDQKDVWSGDIPICEIIQCSRPSVENGVIASNLTSFNYSEEIKIECNKGYEILKGSTIRTCQDDGNWGPQQLTCDKITCNDTSDVFHKAITSDPLLSLKFDDVQNVTFNKTHFYLIHGFMSVICSWDRKLKWISPPDLVPVCPVQVIDNIEYNNNQCLTPDICKEGTLLHYTCKPGFVAASTAVECLEDHTWSITPLCAETTKAAEGLGQTIVALAVLGWSVATIAIAVGIFQYVYIRRLNSHQPRPNPDIPARQQPAAIDLGSMYTDLQTSTMVSSEYSELQRIDYEYELPDTK